MSTLQRAGGPQPSGGSSVTGREVALKGDAEVDGQERVHDRHRRVAARGGDRAVDRGGHALQRHWRSAYLIGIDRRRARPGARGADERVGGRGRIHRIAGRVGQLQSGRGGDAGEGMGVVGQVVDRSRDVFGAGDFTDDARGQAQAIALAQRQATLQVGQHERGLAVASVRHADQGEQGLVLGKGKRLPVAQRPIPGCKVKGE